MEYLDDEGDYYVLGDDEQSLQEMFNCTKVTGSDSACYRLNVKVTAAEPSPVKGKKLLPASPLMQLMAPQPDTAEKSCFVNNETHPHGEHSHQITTVYCPLESYVSTGTKTTNSEGGGDAKKDQSLQS